MGRLVSAVASGLRLPHTVTGYGRRSLFFSQYCFPPAAPRAAGPLPACCISGAGGAWGVHPGLGGGGGRVRVGTVPPAAVHRGSGGAHRPHPMVWPHARVERHVHLMARGMGMPPQSVPPPFSLRMHTPDHDCHTRLIPTPAVLSACPSSLIPTCVSRASRSCCPHASSSRAGRCSPLLPPPPAPLPPPPPPPAAAARL